LGYSLNIPVNINYFINNRARVRFSAGAIFSSNPDFIFNMRNSISDFNSSVYDSFRLLTPFVPRLFGGGESSQLYGSINYVYAFF
jgi:hypothetical protein